MTTSTTLGTAPSSRLRSLLLLGAAGALSLGTLSLAAPADAAEIDNAFTDVETTGTIAVGQTFQLTANWKVPDNSQPGDTFSLQLPDELEPVQKDFELRDAAGDVVATAKADGGVVTVTLTDYVLAHPKNIQGTLFFDIYVEQGTEAGETLVIRWGDSSKTIEPGEGTYGSNLEDQHTRKYAWSAGDTHNGWTIEVAGPFTAGTISDTAKDQRILCDTVEVVIGTRSGSTLPDNFAAPETPLPAPTCTNHGPGDAEDDTLIVPVGDLPEGSVVRVMYASQPDPGKETVTNSYTFASSEFDDEGSAEDKVYRAGGDASGENDVTPTETTPPPPTETTTPPAETTTPPAETTTPPAETTTPPAETTTPAPTTASPSTTPAAASPTPRLPRTGAEVLPLAAVAAGLVALGTGAVAVARRRR